MDKSLMSPGSLLIYGRTMNEQRVQQVSKHSPLIHLVDFQGAWLGTVPGPGDPRPRGDESETGLGVQRLDGGHMGDLRGQSPPLAGSRRPHLCNGSKRNPCSRRGIQVTQGLSLGSEKVGAQMRACQGRASKPCK